MIHLQNRDGTISVYEKLGEKPLKTVKTNREAIEFCRKQDGRRKSSPKPAKPASRVDQASKKEDS